MEMIKDTLDFYRNQFNFDIYNWKILKIGP
jgi:hypothetical protein